MTFKEYLKKAKQKAEDKEEFEDVEEDILGSLERCEFDRFIVRVFRLYETVGIKERELRRFFIPDLFGKARKAWNKKCRL